MQYFIFLFFFFCSSSAFAEESFSLYTGMEPMSISKKELKKYLIGQKNSWENGESVVILLYPSASPQMTFLCTEIIGIPEATYRRFIIEKAFRSGLQLIEIEETQNVHEAIQNHPGTIVVFSEEDKSTFETEKNVVIHPITVEK